MMRERRQDPVTPTSIQAEVRLQDALEEVAAYRHFRPHRELAAIGLPLRNTFEAG